MSEDVSPEWQARAEYADAKRESKVWAAVRADDRFGRFTPEHDQSVTTARRVNRAFKQLTDLGLA